MTPQAIRIAIAASSSLKALVTAGQWDELAKQLGAAITKHESTVVDAKKLASLLGLLPAERILLALERARDEALGSESADTQLLGSALRRQLGFMASGGIDFGDEEFLSLVDTMVALGYWTTVQGAALKRISQVPETVTEFEVRDAVFDKQGNLLV